MIWHPAFKRAKEMRLKGYSYNEIAGVLDVSKGTLSLWFRNLKLSKEARERLEKRYREGSLRGLIKKSKQQTEKAIELATTIRNGSQKEIKRLTRYEWCLIGAVFYWAEGYKRSNRAAGHHVKFANSDPSAIACMMRFFREICRVPEEKFRLAIHTHPGINIDEAYAHWSKVSGIPVSQFEKPYIAVSSASKKRRPFNRLPFGTAHVRINDTKLFHRIMGWIQGIGHQVSWRLH